MAVSDLPKAPPAAGMLVIDRSDGHSEVLRGIIGASPNGVVVLNHREEVLLANATARVILGPDFHYLTEGKLPDRWRLPREESYTLILGDPSHMDGQLSVERDDGSQIHVEVSERTVHGERGLYYLWICRDVTETFELTQALHESQINFRNIVDKNQSGILILNTAGRVRHWNKAVESMLGRSAEELQDMLLGIPVKTDTRSEMQIIRSDGRLGIAETVFTETEWKNEKAFLVMLQDVTAAREAQAQVAHLIDTDVLTQLPNRHSLTLELERAMRRTDRAGQRLALLFLDVDRFKVINDTLGHQAGDRLLVEIARRLRSAVRVTDSVARLGGDEFAVICENFSDDRDIEGIAKKICVAIGEPFFLAGEEVVPSASIGASVYPDDGLRGEDLLRQADTAMYRAKNSGTHFAWYAGIMTESLVRVTELERQLRQAIEQQQFRLYYQVQVDLKTRKPIGYEALLRWQHPERGLVGPAEFIPILEDTGLIREVGDWVLREACQQLRTWKDRGDRLLPVAVNLSALQIEHDDLPTTLVNLMGEFALEPALLNLELTESAMLSYIGDSITRLQALADLGFDLHVDDFGTGYSSLSLIKLLPFVTIKIDQSFVHDLVHNRQDFALTEATVTMCHGLGKQSLAEGIETEEQLEALRSVGCNFGQGYLFGRPAPAAARQADQAGGR